jgi:hypothetical protein
LSENKSRGNWGKNRLSGETGQGHILTRQTSSKRRSEADRGDPKTAHRMETVFIIDLPIQAYLCAKPKRKL